MLAGQRAGRGHAAEVTVFDSVGFALEDFAALAFMGETAAELGLGEIIELVPHAADPKNLFGVLRGSQAVLAPKRDVAAALRNVI